jgi:hypothetical protein
MLDHPYIYCEMNANQTNNAGAQAPRTPQQDIFPLRMSREEARRGPPPVVRRELCMEPRNTLPIGAAGPQGPTPSNVQAP